MSCDSEYYTYYKYKIILNSNSYYINCVSIIYQKVFKIIITLNFVTLHYFLNKL